MPKVDGDSRERDARNAADASNAETPNVKASNAQTSQDDIPPVHVLEAAQNQDRKETEDLLAGFDRPGRSPKPVSHERDFVDYYAKKKSGSGLDSGSGRPTSSAPPPAGHAGAAGRAGSKQAELSTVVVPRKREGMPAWLSWMGAGALLLLIGGGIAYVATDASSPTSGVSAGPSAATTITAATPVPHSAFDNVPPPEPAVVEPVPAPSPMVTAVTDAPVAKGPARRDRDREPRNATSATAGSSVPRSGSATGDTKPPPRDDFIRDL